ncbi:MAG: cardiolipin synthase [Treponema sp.]|nr:cardiolipin synthase [Treponema sp.]
MKPKWIRIVFKRRLLIISLILAQLLFILLFITGAFYAFRYVNFVMAALSIIVCVYIVNKKEKAAYKMTWIFLILLFPLFGGVVYIFFHTQSKPRKLKKQTLAVAARYKSFFLPAGGDVLKEFGEKHRDGMPQAHYLQVYSGFPLYKRTQTLYLNSGESFFHKALEEMQKAKKYIFLEFFILREGKMLGQILDMLEEKAREGLDVRIIYDDLGCFMSLPSNFCESLKSRSIKCMIFNPFKPILSSLQNNRDHRKIISIDGKVAFTGSMNIGDEYINYVERFGYWKDSAIMLQGEAAWSLTLIFLYMWNLERRYSEQDDAGDFYPWKNSDGTFALCTEDSDGYVQPYADSPIDKENVGEHVYIQIINNAKEYVYINTPYLVVDENLLSALSLSAKSGVDVRIITPYRWDKWIVSVVSRSYYRHLINSGVKIYEFTAGFNHSKTFVSDDKVATVGTTNLDFRSLYLHFECGVWLYKTQSVSKVKEDFFNVLSASKEITLKDCSRNAVQRVIQDVLRLFAPLM